MCNVGVEGVNYKNMTNSYDSESYKETIIGDCAAERGGIEKRRVGGSRVEGSRAGPAVSHHLLALGWAECFHGDLRDARSAVLEKYFGSWLENGTGTGTATASIGGVGNSGRDKDSRRGGGGGGGEFEVERDYLRRRHYLNDLKKRERHSGIRKVGLKDGQIEKAGQMQKQKQRRDIASDNQKARRRH